MPAYPQCVICKGHHPTADTNTKVKDITRKFAEYLVGQQFLRSAHISDDQLNLCVDKAFGKVLEKEGMTYAEQFVYLDAVMCGVTPPLEVVDAVKVRLDEALKTVSPEFADCEMGRWCQVVSTDDVIAEVLQELNYPVSKRAEWKALIEARLRLMYESECNLDGHDHNDN